MHCAPAPSATLCSIQVGTPQAYGFENALDTHDKPWRTGFFKTPVEGRVFVGRTNLDGDGQADLENHGGIDKAVLAYSADHYSKWRREIDLPDLPYGAFGENLTISGLSEESVCIGDTLRIGAVVVRGEPAAAALLEAGPPLAHARVDRLGGAQRAKRLVSSSPAGRLDRGLDAGGAIGPPQSRLADCPRQ